MNTSAAAGGRIAGIILLSVLLVVMVHALTGSVIKRQEERRIYEDLKSLAPNRSFGFLKNTPGADPVMGYYPALGRSGEAETYIVIAQGKGYSSLLKLYVHCGADGEILAARLFPTREYPGMGKEAENPAYMKKFIGTGAVKPVPLEAGGLSPKDADAVSGASVTFRGVAGALAAAAAFVRNGGTKK